MRLDFRLATLAAVAIGIAACSSFSGNNGPKDAGAGGKSPGSGGATGTGGMATSTGGMTTATGGATGTGGSMVDAAVDQPVGDGGACDPDGGADCCPDDPLKTAPGACGCGFADFDTDGDGVADCNDQCPNDATKTMPGVCGCNVADFDTDHDGVLDCVDACPRDPAHGTMPGLCGCGVPDNTPLCLVHRYQFNDLASPDGGVSTDAGADAGAAISGAVIHDSVGGADGIAVRCAPGGNGSITLANPVPSATADQYIQLPAGIISSIGNNATFEAWINWNDGGFFWQRIFDFGASLDGVNNRNPPGVKGANSDSHLFVTPRGLAAPGVMLVSFINVGVPVNEAQAATGLLTAGTMQHLALVVNSTPADGGAPSMILYVNGAAVATAPLSNQLSNLLDVNNWLGRSQYAADPSFAGTYFEFRIYSSARSAAQIAASFASGPDALPGN
jgi:hypothetical protein